MAETFYPQESIYNLLPDLLDAEKPKHSTRFRPAAIRLDDKVSKIAMKTMGPAKVETPSPEKYLKKHSREPKLPQKKEGPRRTCTARKPAVPLRSEQPPAGRKSPKAATAPVRPRPSAASVDTNRGHKELLEHSGLVPKYVKKKGYGEVPQYLQHRGEELQRSAEEYDKYLTERTEEGPMRRLSDEERRANLESLKKTLAELQDKYRRLPVVVDTLTRKSRKLQLEAEMKQLESDVELFQRFKTIYIAK
ncbi:enkurin [Syngnathoides biaculeatus]|uniref:enkurin n=1 Tax=Syngnathoides biaculeatus TaxID=300417 RepID=UPI002ADD8B87|nr:enkurin [Syngnathoides biaculeatus]